MNLLVNVIAKQIMKGLDDEIYNRSPLMQEAFLNDMADLLEQINNYIFNKQAELVEGRNKKWNLLLHKSK